MTFPYKFRILACLPNDTPIELMRSQQKWHVSYWRTATNELAREWTCWLEEPMRDQDCISARPRFKQRTGAEKLTVHLSAEEKREAGIAS
jgi:hypothetical protein